MEKAVVLLSGGLDSSTLLHVVRREWQVPEVYALTVIYGQKHARELEMARWQAAAAGVAEHQVVEIPAFGTLVAGASALTDATLAVPDLAALDAAGRRQPPTYVPNRNLVLLALAGAYAEARGATHVLYGAQAQDEYGYWDCTAAFVERLNAVLALNRGRAVTVQAPFVGLAKADVVRRGAAVGVDFGRTWSCYRGGERSCGTCPTCVERAAAFLAAGLPDPLEGLRVRP